MIVIPVNVTAYCPCFFVSAAIFTASRASMTPACCCFKVKRSFRADEVVLAPFKRSTSSEVRSWTSLSKSSARRRVFRIADSSDVSKLLSVFSSPLP